MKEYVLRIVKRDPEHPLSEELILEAATDVTHPHRFAISLESLCGVLKEVKTPERLAQFIRDNAHLAVACRVPTERQGDKFVRRTTLADLL